MKNKKLLLQSSVGLLLIVLSFLVILNFGSIKNFFYLSHNNISSELKSDSKNYLKQKDDNYLVYFYNSKECNVCNNYTEQIKKYETEKDALKVYKADSSKLTDQQLTEELFVDKHYPYVIHVKKASEFYRYVGTHVVKKLPTLKTVDEDPFLKK